MCIRDRTEIIYQKHANDKNKIEINEYIDNIHEYYGWADIIICRAGALTVSEVSASGSLGIFIPLPWAIDNHQFFNAKQLKDLNAGFLIEENKNLEQDLIKILNDIKKIIMLSKKILTDQGVLFIENGIDQTEKISRLLQANDFTDISVHMDYNGHERFTSSYKK